MPEPRTRSRQLNLLPTSRTTSLEENGGGEGAKDTGGAVLSSESRACSGAATGRRARSSRSRRGANMKKISELNTGVEICRRKYVRARAAGAASLGGGGGRTAGGRS